MGYQPKSYRKFLSASVSAAVVATALAPVAASAANTGSFSDVPAANQAQVSWAVSQGIVKGYADNTFKPFDKIDRTHAAVMLANALNLTIPTSVSAAPFADVPADSTYAPYIKAVKDAGVFKGSNGYFHGSQVLTREQMAAVLVNAYNLQDNGKNVMVADKAEADAYAQAPIQTLADLGITVLPGGNFNPKGENARIHLVSFLYQVNQYMNEAPAIASVKATGSSQLTVNFDKAVDTSKAMLTVKRSSADVNVKSVTFSNDKKSATIELASKMYQGTYTVNVAGLTDQALTSSVDVKDEQVGSIKLLSDQLALDATNTTEATVAFKVYNQYGEDITSTGSYNINWTSSTGSGNVTASGNVLTVKKSSDFTIGEHVYLTGVETNTGAHVSSELTIGQSATASSMTFDGVYNADGNDLTNSNATSGDFYLLVNAKDQYGNDLSFSDIQNNFVVTSTNPSVAEVSTTTGDTLVGNNTSGSNGDQIGLKLTADSSYNTYGTATIQLINKHTGQVFSTEVTVKQAAAVSKLNLEQPTDVVAANDGTVKIPFTAFDQFGNKVTSYDEISGNVTLSPSSTSSTPSLDLKKNYVTGDAYLEYKLDGTTGKHVLTAMVGTNYSQIVLDVKDAATPAVISGTSDLTTNLAVGATTTIGADNLTAIDQYGRSYTLDSSFFNDYKIKVAAADGTGNHVSIGGGDSGWLTTTASTLTLKGEAAGSEGLDVSIYKKSDGSLVSGSTLSLTANTVAKSDISSYEVADIPTLYSTTGYTVTLDVHGKMANGDNVVLPSSQYTVQSLMSGVTATGDTLDANGVNFGTDTQKTGTVVVVVDGADGAVTLTKSITVSNVAPEIKSLSLASTSNINVDGNVEDGSVGNVSIPNIIGTFTAKDQYGVDVSSSLFNSNSTYVYFTNFSSGNTATSDDVTFTNGAIGTAKIDQTSPKTLVAGDSFNMTFVTASGITKTIKVVVDK